MTPISMLSFRKFSSFHHEKPITPLTLEGPILTLFTIGVSALMLTVMRLGRKLINFGVVILLSIFSLQAHALEYQFGPVPSWVVPVNPESNTKDESRLHGEYSLLSDTQTRIDQFGKTSYVHIASKALDSRGVERVGDISMVFDPTYQTLTLNVVRIIRGSVVIDKLRSSSIRVSQRETERDYQVYDGSKTVDVVLDDLRVGDIVEYAYSVSGVNPVFKNLIAGGASLQWSVPVAHAFVRLLTPAARSFTISTRNSKTQPEISVAAGYREYRWDLHDIAGLHIEKDAPDNYDPYASVQWSEFADWASVVRWALPLYSPPAEIGKDLGKEIERIRQSSALPQERLMAALLTVQHDIRYLGVEVGQGSHAPSPPAFVFKRRFGDCKDKALLTVTMLRALGIEAHTALVHTHRLAAVGDYGVTPTIFNHAIVFAKIGNRAYWLDPTHAPQHSDLAHLSQPDYGLALVIDPATRALLPMASPVLDRTEVHAVFDLTSSLGQPAIYTIKTTIHGRAAERLRSQLVSDGINEMGRDYLNYYARRYPAIKSLAPLAVSDDEISNTLITTESYAIPQFWSHSVERGERNAYIRSAEIRSYLSQPDAMNRTAPLALDAPIAIDEVCEVKLPRHWKITPDDTTVSDPAFEYRHQTIPDKSERGFVLIDHYRTLADRVAPGAMKRYAGHLRQAYDEVGLSLSLSDHAHTEVPVSEQLPWRSVVMLVLLLVWILFGLLWQTSPPPHRRTDRNLLICFITATALLLLVLVVPANAFSVGRVLVFALVYANVFIRRVALAAPESHWIYMVVRPGPVHGQAVGFRVIVGMLRLLTNFILWIVALLLLFGIFRFFGM